MSTIAHFPLPLITLLLLALMTTSLRAEQKQSFGDYDVHYSVLNSTFLQPDVAQRYGITRGEERAVVNIAIRRNQDDGSDSAVAAKVSGESSDLIHTTPLNFRQFDEGKAIYYLAEFEFMDKEVRNFTIRIQPESGIAPYTLKFSQRLYANP